MNVGQKNEIFRQRKARCNWISVSKKLCSRKWAIFIILPRMPSTRAGATLGQPKQCPQRQGPAPWGRKGFTHLHENLFWFQNIQRRFTLMSCLKALGSMIFNSAFEWSFCTKWSIRQQLNVKISLKVWKKFQKLIKYHSLTFLQIDRSMFKIKELRNFPKSLQIMYHPLSALICFLLDQLFSMRQWCLSCERCQAIGWLFNN